MNKTKQTKVKGREITFPSDRNLFARLMVIGTVRKVDIREMLTYSLGPLPLALANHDGSLVKTNKAALMHSLESAITLAPVIESIPRGSVWICDGMAMLQMLKNIPDTFGLLGEHVLKQLIYQTIAVGSTGSHVMKIYSPDQKVPSQWKKFLSNGKNKENLIEFFAAEWSKSPSGMLKGVKVFIAHGLQCHVIQANGNCTGAEHVEELSCNHEEADTRLVLHGAYAAKSKEHNIIYSPDTDNFVIALAFVNDMGGGICISSQDLETMREQFP
ncbi:hypothetical protein HOLleu_38360 [Holothuria leucospilota]|uniref:Uncharacterized protein n=1 Tax=Holothuria leucospilota TaxID=206669 RepID=A0A9Q0YIK4_HOLLE|nr:hypothetical protein HOLleu_38360 [Holothuria leucospilota]